MKNLLVCTLAIAIVGAPVAQSASASSLKNVELTKSGELRGQLVTSTGLAVPDNVVSLVVGDQKLNATTDAEGRFRFPGLTTGRAVLRVGEDTFACRLWANGIAPPGSISTIGLVASETSEIRGQSLVPAPLLAPAAKIAALSTKQLIGLGLIVAGTTVGIAAAAADDDAS